MTIRPAVGDDFGDAPPGFNEQWGVSVSVGVSQAQLEGWCRDAEPACGTALRITDGATDGGKFRIVLLVVNGKNLDANDRQGSEEGLRVDDRELRHNPSAKDGGCRARRRALRLLAHYLPARQPRRSDC